MGAHPLSRYPEAKCAIILALLSRLLFNLMRKIFSIFHWPQSSPGSLVIAMALCQGNCQVKCDSHVPSKEVPFHEEECLSFSPSRSYSAQEQGNSQISTLSSNSWNSMTYSTYTSNFKASNLQWGFKDWSPNTSQNKAFFFYNVYFWQLK